MNPGFSKNSVLFNRKLSPTFADNVTLKANDSHDLRKRLKTSLT